MIQSYKDYIFFLEEDRKRNKISSNRLRRIWGCLLGEEKYRAWNYLRTLRKVEYYLNCRKTFLGRILYKYYNIKYRRLGVKYNIFLPVNRVGYGFRIIHLAGGGGCLLACTKIGNYCAANSGVLAGRKFSWLPGTENIWDSNKNMTKNISPTLGDYVTLGPGCKLIGPITVGSHSFIGPNSVVVENIPENSIVVGSPGKVIKTVIGGDYSK